MKVFAHRGASAEAPENTLGAFALALDLGADGVELDVRLTADGVPVVLHDGFLDRTTSGTGAVRDLSLADLRAVDAGNGQGLPTLAEVVDLIAGRAFLDVEIKAAEAGPATLALLTGVDIDGWAISSFDWEVLRWLRTQSSQAGLWPLMHMVSPEALRFASDISAPILAVHHDAVDAVMEAELGKRGLGLMVWTVNDRERAKELQRMGVRSLCTDDPRSIRTAIETT